MTCVLLWFDTFTVHRHKRSADLSEVKRIPRRVISEYLQLFCGGRCRMIETASIFRARNQRGEKRNRESMSGNQTHQWKEHFRHGGPYLSPPDRQKTTSTCSTFNRHPSWLPKVPIWLVMDQTGLNVGLHPYGWSWAAISPGQPSVSWLSPLTAEVVAAERMIKLSVHGSKWFPPHAILLIPGEIDSIRSTIGTEVTGQAADIDVRVKTCPLRSALIQITWHQ